MIELKRREPENDIGIKDYLTEEERKKLVDSLHHAMVWVGVKVPQELELDRTDLQIEMEQFHQTESDLPPEVHSRQGKIELHRLIWRLINENEITEKERLQIEEILELLERKEKVEEESLSRENLTPEQALRLRDEAAGIIRAILELKDLLKDKKQNASRADVAEEHIRHKVNEAKRWTQLMDEIKNG